MRCIKADALETTCLTVLTITPFSSYTKYVVYVGKRNTRTAFAVPGIWSPLPCLSPVFRRDGVFYTVDVTYKFLGVGT